jgi:hypothetical protein
MANKYLRKYLTPSAATETTIYTVPAANLAIVSSLRVTNTSASTTNLTAAVYPEGGATPYYVLKSYVLPANATMDIFSGVSIVLSASDVLKVTSSQADSDFYLSYLEVDRT